MRVPVTAWVDARVPRRRVYGWDGVDVEEVYDRMLEILRYRWSVRGVERSLAVDARYRDLGIEQIRRSIARWGL